MKHVWVAIQFVPVDVSLNKDTGKLDWHITVEADNIAKEDAALGCWICEVQLDHSTYNTECAGEAPTN